DQPALAINVVRHIGEPVVLVVAADKVSAQSAALQVVVEYKKLEAVLDPIEALSDASPLVHPAGNLLSQFNVDSGDLVSGFNKADIVFEETFTTQRVAPAYMEMETSLASYHPNGTISVWVSSQEPFIDRARIAATLNLEVEKVQVLSTVIGGAFGGKEDSSLAIITAIAAWLTKGTVRMVNNRSESFVAHPKRHPVKIHLKIGAMNDGTIIALDGKVWLNTGAYASYGPAVGSLLTEMVAGPYNIPNAAIETKVVYTHTPYSGAMRGFGSPQAHFAIESAMDMLAERLKMDSIDIRRKNLLHTGDILPTRVQLNETALGLEPILQQASAAVKRLNKINPKAGKRSGVGLAMAMQSMGLGNGIADNSKHRLEWLPDGRVLIHLGAPDLGQGLVTVAEQITAEVLGLPFDQVVSSPFNSNIVPDGGVVCASRMTYLVGNAMIDGARRLIQELLDQAAVLLDQPKDKLTYSGGKINSPDGNTFSASEFASRAAEQGIPILVEASASFSYPEATTPQHLPIGMPHVKFLFGAQVARVEVDAELGIVEVTDLVAIHDPGKVINRLGAEGQIEGGVVMGIGYALYEDMNLKSNDQWINSFTEYLLPTSLDVPTNLEVQMLEYPEADGPYGAKGLAEICTVPTAPAIANAVYNAVGLRVKDLPITPEKLYQASQIKP
ncbi:MAG: xanthine dehydrogenase family protein molybdopterin-binding subunit, partial [Anaerolineaceae bacterium]|nr:xanthine dehydrogenase family protein molybdopterin-binding subunit [Anaerolineaceae bacterium]